VSSYVVAHSEKEDSMETTHVASDQPTDVEGTEFRYFASLVTGNLEQLERVLADDFLVVDVFAGAVVDRTAFLGAIRDGLVAFERAQVIERETRRYGDVAVVVGRSELAGRFAGERFLVNSRYTHVLVRNGDGTWRLAGAQGTRIDET